MSNGTIAVDLDGTLAVYDGVWRGVDNIGAPIPRMVNRVKRWLAEGRSVVIFTARMYGHGQPDIETGQPVNVEGPIRRWCAEHLGQEIPVTCVKDFSICEIWDDRAVQVIPNTGQTIQEKLDEVKFELDRDSA